MPHTFPTLQTERLDLIAIEQRHQGDLFALFGNSDVTKYYNIVTLKNEEEAQKILDWFRSRFADGLAVRWGIALKGSDHIIGTAGFNNFTKHHRAGIGYDLLPGYWGKGYITEALGAIIEYGFTTLEVNRIEAEVMEGNVASEKVLGKLGFTNEGLLRQWMYWNNRYYDMTMFSLLRG